MKRIIPLLEHCYECPYRVEEQWSRRLYCTHKDAWKTRCPRRGTARGISEMDAASDFPTWCPLKDTSVLEALISDCKAEEDRYDDLAVYNACKELNKKLARLRKELDL